MKKDSSPIIKFHACYLFLNVVVREWRKEAWFLDFPDWTIVFFTTGPQKSLNTTKDDRCIPALFKCASFVLEKYLEILKNFLLNVYETNELYGILC